MKKDGQVVLRTLDEYLESFTLSAYCDSCKRHVILERAVHFKNCRGDLPLEAVRQRLLCRICRRRPDGITVGWRHGSPYGRGNAAMAGRTSPRKRRSRRRGSE